MPGLLAGLMILMLAGCAGLKSREKYSEFIMVDVFASESNAPGLQSGWFGKIVKDKFNMELNVIAPNAVEDGDSLFQTRVASGSVGDLLICNVGGGILKQLADAGLILDMEKWLDDDSSVMKYRGAVERFSRLAGREGIYAVPTELSENSPTTPAVGLEPNYGPYLRWDIYEKIGCPPVEDLEDLLSVLKQMQEAYPVTEQGEPVYALSLFGDWDRNMMTFARNVACFYGYDEVGMALLSSDSGEIQNPAEKDSVYRRGIDFLYQANQMGLIDPDSPTQNYETVYRKTQNGQVLFAFWSWFGQQAYNTPGNTAEGKGFKMVPIQDMKISVNGCQPGGSSEMAVMIGSQAEDPARLADFIDWLYSPEGIMASQASGPSDACGPEGLTWEMKESGPALTEFGRQALGGEMVSVPAEWGGGTWQEGVCAFNVTFVQTVDTNPETGVPYMYTLWESARNERTLLDERWTAVTGADNAMEYLETQDMLVAAPGDSYASGKEDYQITTIRSQCADCLTDYSWKMVFAGDEETYAALAQTMTQNLENLKFDLLFTYDSRQAEEKYRERQDMIHE